MATEGPGGARQARAGAPGQGSFGAALADQAFGLARVRRALNAVGFDLAGITHALASNAARTSSATASGLRAPSITRKRGANSCARARNPARIRSLAYTGHEALFFDTDTPPPDGAGFPVDVYISPEELVTQYVERLIQLADRHTIIERGRVAWQGTSAELDADHGLWHRYLGV